MSYRFMRLLVMFDLPTETLDDQRNYRQFRKMLIKNGFVMMQESVYTKLMVSPSAHCTVMQTLRKNKPPKGFVCALEVTEKQFAAMECLVGQSQSEVLDTDERLVIF